MAKCPPEKQIYSLWPVETLCIDKFLSVAMILCNKMDFSLVRTWLVFVETVLKLKIIKMKIDFFDCYIA